VRLNLALGEGLPAIEGDSSQIQQVVMNLVINGAEALGPERDAVEVHTRARHAEQGELAAGVTRPPFLAPRFASSFCARSPASRPHWRNRLPAADLLRRRILHRL
jgi:signal transduction histidine kinase